MINHELRVESAELMARLRSQMKVESGKLNSKLGIQLSTLNSQL